MKNLKSHTLYEIPSSPVLTPSKQRAALFGVKDAYNVYDAFLVEAGTDFLELSIAEFKIYLFECSFSMSSVFLWYQNQLNPQRTARLKHFALSHRSPFELTNK